MSTTPNEAPQSEAPPESVPVPPDSHGQVIPPVPPQAPSSPAYGYMEPPAGYGPQQPLSAPPLPPPALYGEPQYLGFIDGYPAHGQSLRAPRQQDASNSLIMGIIGAALAVLIGWIPIFGLVGVAGGLGLGIPALIQGRRAEEGDATATWGKAMGWVAIAFSILWVALYTFLIVAGALSGSSSDYGTSDA